MTVYRLGDFTRSVAHTAFAAPNASLIGTICVAKDSTVWFLAIPATNAFELPRPIDDEIAPILDIVDNATHTAHAFNVVGEDVLIAGPGPHRR